MRNGVQMDLKIDAITLVRKWVQALIWDILMCLPRANHVSPTHSAPMNLKLGMAKKVRRNSEPEPRHKYGG